ncbi:MAG: cyclic nucleotide-binding domain-containing protein [Aggregatilineales bacterium]
MSVSDRPTFADLDFALLAQVPLLEGLQMDDFGELAPFLEARIYEPGDTLFLKGDPGGALIIVLDGEVELFVYDGNNKRFVLSAVTVGGFFGEVTLFDQSTRSTNAMATQHTRVVVLRQEVMTSFLRKHPESSIHIINVLSKRLRDTTQLVTAKEDGNAFEMLQESTNVWEHLADRVSAVVGSWGYLGGLVCLILAWVVISVLRNPAAIPVPLDILGILITTLGALQLPLILMSQNRQDRFEQIQADLDHQVNVKAQLSILEVTRKLDWLQEAMLEQARRLDRLEQDHPELNAPGAREPKPS